MSTVTPPIKPHHRPLPLKVGTRGSPLARAQTATFLGLLERFCPVLRDMPPVFEEHIIVTTGDAVQNRALAEIGGKGLFAKEIHESLAAGRIDFAVHSLKDLETVLPPGITLACTLKREDARDVLVLPPGHAPADPADPFAVLKKGARIGSASVRRQAQLKHARPDLEFALLRGNVGTRLAKIEAGELDATLLAYAGLRRLGLGDKASVVLSTEQMVPSACQGIVGITVRSDDVELRELLAAIEDPEAKAVATAERALLGALDGSCRTPIGGYARLLDDDRLHLTGLVARADGSFLLRRSATGSVADAEILGQELGLSLKADSPDDIFAP
ncbi:MAG TPA: hydroxymethylbilane synthase [Acidocella sp.]|uniref:hydroxymethylbilane synthase n=1 Tax=Acidocella sp. TaxID=50710 RepID=UPI002B53AF8B|nr:hydroxymethylbilane synthase [Acidocella sp.]HVE21006.1 hydroxymethylbilane synthase [Acidocella sp.]